MSGNSPFGRSGIMRRSPPPTLPALLPPVECSPLQPAPPQPEPEPAAEILEEEPPRVIRTADIHGWMTTIEPHLNEICSISTEGKLNTDQKLKIGNICRKVGHYTSQIAVEYQSLKHHAIQAYQARHVHQEKVNIAQSVQELKGQMEQLAKPSLGTFSFADALKNNAARCVQPSNISSVAIYPTDKLKSSEETKSLIQEIIRPDEMKLHVSGLRKVKNGGVVISSHCKEDIVKLKQSAQLIKSGLTVDETQKRKPRIVVIGVPAAMQETEVFKCIFHQNLADKMTGLSLDTFLTSSKLSHKSGKKDAETCNYVIEVPATIRKALIQNDRVYVNWSSCPVRDFTLVTRCYKCQQYGHAAKTCHMETNTCGHCGVVGHAIKDCTKKSEPSKCATCLLYKKPCDHETGSTECPARKIAEKRYINSVDYESS